MKVITRKALACLGLLVTACGGSNISTPARQATPAAKPAELTEQKSTSTASEPAAELAKAPPEVEPKVAETQEVPSRCALGARPPCLPPEAFAESICKGKYPGLALFMFEKSTPWQRKWVNREQLAAVNAFGGSNSGGDLTFAEEVLLLRRGSARTDEVQVSGADDVEVLRWNGTCVTVRESELVEYVPGLPKHADIVWNYLGRGLQEALLGNTNIASLRKRHKQECRGSSAHSVSKSCGRAAQTLGDAIVIAVRKGTTLPEPQKLPFWVDERSGHGLAAAEN